MFVSDEFDYMHEFLKRTQKARPLFPGVEWIEYERLSMLLAVNGYREQDNMPLRTLADIERVEQMAAGHYDYTKKFALYCAELVHTDPEVIRP